MIIDIDVSFTMAGTNFLPNKVENLYNITLEETELKGEIGKKGRYKNKPLPKSSACINNKKEEGYIDHSEIERIAILAADIYKNRKKLLIEYTSFFITYYYCAQCALGFTKKELKLFSKLNEIAIDCVQLYDHAEIEGIDNFSDKVRLYNNGKFEKEYIQKYRKSRNNLYTKEILSLSKLI